MSSSYDTSYLSPTAFTDGMRDWIKANYAQWYITNEETRMKQAAIRDAFYYCDRVAIDTYIRQIFIDRYNMTEDDANKFFVYWRGWTPKIVNRLAMIYKNAPERKLITDKGEVNDKATKLYATLCERIRMDYNLRLANRGMVLHNNVGTKVSVVEDRAKIKSINLRSYSPQHVLVMPTEKDYLIPEIVASAGVAANNAIAWTVETEFEIRDIDEEGNVIDVRPNETGMIRWAFARYASDGGDFWSGYDASDIVLAAEASAQILSSQQEIGIWNGFPLVLSHNIPEDRLKRNPGAWMNIDAETESRRASIDATYLEISGIAVLREYEKEIWLAAALARNLPRSSIGLDNVTINSGYQEWLECLPLEEMRADQKLSMLACEKEIFEIIKALSQKDRDLIGGIIPDGLSLQVDYADSSMSLSAIEKLDILERKMKLNLTNPLSALMEDNPDLDEEAAFEKYQYNRALNSKLPKAKPSDTWADILASLDDDEEAETEQAATTDMTEEGQEEDEQDKEKKILPWE